ncbi:HNH endonuclease [Acholeplasma hippikon]|uniref:HNH nuclease domain-containing protein n=1 Tax=Acholeplasma hippikon TaxID=264636 RepID=A0A449BK26_9MOLU|nr:HNH endonuclease [Acholeplasma hippikon]VEU82770.1 Uncharacterised protein [Acholeplasma hippikon]
MNKIFEEELKNLNTSYFIFDTGHNTHEDEDFRTYSWDSSKYNRVKEGDLFLYRKPNRATKNNMFYFFGAGKVEQIIKNGTSMKAIISKPYVFEEFLLGKDLLEFKWKFKERKQEGWAHFFNQYGMTQISKDDFINMINFQKTNSYRLEFDERSADELNEEIEVLNKIEAGVFSYESKEVVTKVRGAAQQAFAKKVKMNYKNTCAVTGITHRDFLIASHIIPWAVDKENRINPKNGICLSPIFDKAFDAGYVSFDDNYKLLISKEVKDKVLSDYLYKYKDRKINTYGGDYPDKKFLKWHRENIFRN